MMLSDDVKAEVKKKFQELKGGVKLSVFTQKIECQYCAETRALVEEVGELSGKIEVRVFDFETDGEAVKKYRIDKIPALVVEGDRDFGIRFYGIPAGYEFSSLLEAIDMVSTGRADLEKDTLEFLKSLEKDVHLQVFVTPTCPYCPRAVVLSHAMAMVSDRVRADMVEATEFPHLGQRYGVRGVPKTVINETVSQEGAAPEGMMIEKIREALR